ncbi:MAG: crossover junction endodeoxyribonuclease RuvC [Candidatus Zambryskibacteria bacterium CG22_combo_CG10-13_8_21_14_all_42_17]|uniref:Crossover junction endodeoxyribonuclease RuvC n=1 Tax=Candidatus Zambryskibacteria bacterium CG22_combo_CG10-13_8_21_14_all_42_17 TaxID=1975118 RepID=A0A2H0BEI6_9BACT|nr:MAG: crossover junction endodeoxyribonuclease RuvC [Candidatus Zambryskibacteria bacterium CG22_combo_CG10-13_8_21_14_all_42_17]
MSREYNGVTLAVDPGFDRLGVAVLTREQDKSVLLFSECIKTDPKESKGERLLVIGLRIKEIIEKWQPESLAIETIFFNTNTTSAIGVAEARGVVIYEAKNADLEIFEYGPQTIKIAITGYGKADKIQMETMVKKLIEMPKTVLKRFDDEVDAIAVGITHLASRK